MATQGLRCECSLASIMRLYIYIFFFPLSFFFTIFTYLTVPGLSCGMWESSFLARN